MILRYVSTGRALSPSSMHALTVVRQNTFYALYRSFTECCFIEDEGSIVFYKNKYGLAKREISDDAVLQIKKEGWSQEDQDKLQEGVTSDSTRTD